MPKNFAQEMTQKVIVIFAKAEKPLDLWDVFKMVAKGKVLPESYSYHFRQVQTRFMRWLETNQDDWRSWPAKARIYTQAHEKEPPEKIPPEKKRDHHPHLKATAMPRVQRRLPF